MFHGLSINIEIEKSYSIQVFTKARIHDKVLCVGIILHCRSYAMSLQETT